MSELRPSEEKCQDTKARLVDILRGRLHGGMSHEEINVAFGVRADAKILDDDDSYRVAWAIDKSIDEFYKKGEDWRAKNTVKYHPIFQRGRDKHHRLHAHLRHEDINWTDSEDESNAHVWWSDSGLFGRTMLLHMLVRKVGHWYRAEIYENEYRRNRPDKGIIDVLAATKDQAKKHACDWLVINGGASLVTDEELWSEMKKLDEEIQECPKRAERRRRNADDARKRAVQVMKMAESEAAGLIESAEEDDAYAAQADREPEKLKERIAKIASALRRT